MCCYFFLSSIAAQYRHHKNVTWITIKNYHYVQNRFQRSLCSVTELEQSERLTTDSRPSWRSESELFWVSAVKSHTETQQLHKHSRPQHDLHTRVGAGFDPSAVIDFLCVCVCVCVCVWLKHCKVQLLDIFCSTFLFLFLLLSFSQLVNWILNMWISWQTQNLINFLHFSRVSSFVKVTKSENNHVILILSDLKSDFIHGRFVRLRVRLIPFDFSATHPGNFEVVLLTSSRVFRLIRIIQDRVGIQTYRLEVFRSRVPREEARLTPESSLEECGFRGGPEETPPEDTVYYDYTLLFTDCPVLNCDHYFRSTSRWDSAAFRSSQRP